MKFKCPLCKKKMERRAGINTMLYLQSMGFIIIIGITVSLLTNKDFNSHSDNVNLSWNCAKCDAETFPFNVMNENDFFLSNFSGNDTVSNDVNLVPYRDLLKFYCGM